MRSNPFHITTRGIIIWLILGSTLLMTPVITESGTASASTISEVAIDRFNETYAGAKGVAIGDLRALVAYGSSDDPGSLALFLDYKHTFGIAHVTSRNGTESDIPLIGRSIFILKYNRVMEVGMLNGTRTISREIDLSKVDFEISTSRTEVNDTTTEYQLIASTTSDFDGTVGTAAEVRITFHLYVSTITVDNYNYTQYNADFSGANFEFSKEEQSVEEPTEIVTFQVKMDYEFLNWPSEVIADSNITMTFGVHAVRVYPAIVNAFLRHRYKNNETVAVREGDSEISGSDERQVRNRLHFREGVAKLASFGWVKEYTVDGVEKDVTVRIGDIALGKRVFRTQQGARIAASGIGFRGAVIYETGTNIVHDPDVTAQSILPTTETGRRLPIAVWPAIAAIFAIGIATVVLRRKVV